MKGVFLAPTVRSKALDETDVDSNGPYINVGGFAFTDIAHDMFVAVCLLRTFYIFQAEQNNLTLVTIYNLVSVTVPFVICIHQLVLLHDAVFRRHDLVNWIYDITKNVLIFGLAWCVSSCFVDQNGTLGVYSILLSVSKFLTIGTHIVVAFYDQDWGGLLVAKGFVCFVPTILFLAAAYCESTSNYLARTFFAAAALCDVVSVVVMDVLDVRFLIHNTDKFIQVSEMSFIVGDNMTRVNRIFAATLTFGTFILFQMKVDSVGTAFGIEFNAATLAIGSVAVTMLFCLYQMYCRRFTSRKDDFARNDIHIESSTSGKTTAISIPPVSPTIPSFLDSENSSNSTIFSDASEIDRRLTIHQIILSKITIFMHIPLQTIVMLYICSLQQTLSLLYGDTLGLNNFNPRFPVNMTTGADFPGLHILSSLSGVEYLASIVNSISNSDFGEHTTNSSIQPLLFLSLACGLCLLSIIAIDVVQLISKSAERTQSFNSQSKRASRFKIVNTELMRLVIALVFLSNGIWGFTCQIDDISAFILIACIFVSMAAFEEIVSLWK